MQQIDLSYKRNACKVYYDVEVLNDVFTIVMLAYGRLVVTIIADEHYQDVSTSMIRSALVEQVLDRVSTPELCGANPEISVYRCTPESISDDVISVFKQFCLCRNMWEPGRFTEYYGWNSSRYDTLIIAAAYILITHSVFTLHSLKQLSDLIIHYDGPPWRLQRYLGENHPIDGSVLSNKLNFMSWADGHIDIAKLLKSDDTTEDSKYPPGLKKEMAKAGLDIVIDDNVSMRQSRKLTTREFIDLIVYNCNDVIGTMKLGNSDAVTASIAVRDTVREMYPYTSARALPTNKIGLWSAPERDATAANIAGLVLIGESRIKPRDYATVDYTFPLRNGQQVNLLEYMREHEPFMHPDMYAFLHHFQGKDTSTRAADWTVKTTQPVTHSAQINIPYYRDGKPVDAYIRLSTGGAHGSVMAGLSLMTDSEIHDWIRSDTGAIDSRKPTVDLRNVIHADWSSFYPVLASKMQLYKTSEGVDRYTDIINYRVHIKQQLPHVKADWTADDYKLQETQNMFKFVLNNATGAGNMHQKYALLPVDNKTLSMRLIGNMHIWCLAQRLTQAGAFVISTNTDGVYVSGLSLDVAQQVIHEYVQLYGMGVEPEIIDRFINRDTSSRIEYQGNKRSSVRGRLRHGISMRYTDTSLGNNVPYPLVAAHAALTYMDDDNWLTTPYNRERMRSIIQSLLDQSDTPEAWYHVHVGSASRQLTVDGVPAGRVNRVVLTTTGNKLASQRLSAPTKAELSQIIQADNPLQAISSLGYVTQPELHDDSVLAAATTETNPNGATVIRVNTSLTSALQRHDPGLLQGTIGVVDDAGNWEPLKLWKPGTLTGYPSDTGVILNSRELLESFDMSTLDLDAYTTWAETLLAGWKITADIPEINLAFHEDNGMPGSNTRPVQTQRDMAYASVERLYDDAYKLAPGT